MFSTFNIFKMLMMESKFSIHYKFYYFSHENMKMNETNLVFKHFINVICSKRSTTFHNNKKKNMHNVVHLIKVLSYLTCQELNNCQKLSVFLKFNVFFL